MTFVFDFKSQSEIRISLSLSPSLSPTLFTPSLDITSRHSKKDDLLCHFFLNRYPSRLLPLSRRKMDMARSWRRIVGGIWLRSNTNTPSAEVWGDFEVLVFFSVSKSRRGRSPNLINKARKIFFTVCTLLILWIDRRFVCLYHRRHRSLSLSLFLPVETIVWLQPHVQHPVRHEPPCD